MHRYDIDLFWSAEDGCWVADVPVLKTCAAFGDTPIDALAEVQIAIAGWVEVAQEQGHFIP